MSPKIERWMFRLGLIGCLIVIGVFAYELVKDPPVPTRAEDITSPNSDESAPSATTTSTTGPVPTMPAPSLFAAVSPRDQTRVALPQVLVTGVGTPGAVVRAAEQTTTVDARGVWAVRVPLVDGANDLRFVEQAVDGPDRQLTLTVHYEPAAGDSTFATELFIPRSSTASSASTDAIDPASPESTGGIDPESSQPAGTSDITAAAMADLASREGVDVASITVVGVREVTWADSSLGCPLQGVTYTQERVDGVRMVLELEGKRYEYHAGGSSPVPILCANPAPSPSG